ncbi:hypothetical protein BGZ76_008214 [Entomortierella beljakovae]|nr:hypothetical protein BGZ76_008214 [Entomortierella beljakovae]
MHIISTCTLIALSLVGVEAIIGGTPAAPNQFPYVASLFVKEKYGEDHICGGALVGTRSFLTTASCIGGYKPDLLSVRYGGNDRTNLKYTQQVARLEPHPSYDSVDYSNNIAVVTLWDAINIHHSAETIPLSIVAPSPGAGAVFAGWGETSRESPIFSKDLQYIETQIYDKSLCTFNSGSNSYSLPAGNICTLEKSSGVCSGDSGGPLVSDRKLVGLLSRGSCGSGDPDAFTDVSYYDEWLSLRVI